MTGPTRRGGSARPARAAGADFDQLVARARADEPGAWEALVDELSNVVWKTINSFQLPPADRDDAFASTFFRLYDRLDTVREPKALPGWIATTARNEVRVLLRARGRAVPMESLPLRPIVEAEIDERLLDSELTRAALAASPTCHRRARPCSGL